MCDSRGFEICLQFARGLWGDTHTAHWWWLCWGLVAVNESTGQVYWYNYLLLARVVWKGGRSTCWLAILVLLATGALLLMAVSCSLLCLPNEWMILSDKLTKCQRQDHYELGPCRSGGRSWLTGWRGMSLWMRQSMERTGRVRTSLNDWRTSDCIFWRRETGTGAEDWTVKWTFN